MTILKNPPDAPWYVHLLIILASILIVIVLYILALEVIK